MMQDEKLQLIFKNFSGRQAAIYRQLAAGNDPVVRALSVEVAKAGYFLNPQIKGLGYPLPRHAKRVTAYIAQDENGAYRIQSNFRVG